MVFTSIEKMIDKISIQKIFGENVKEKIVSVKRMRSGVSSVVHKIVCVNSQTYFFKQGNTNYDIQFEISKVVSKNDILIPKIVNYTKGWILLKGIDGIKLELTQRSVAKSVLEQFGQILGKVHSIPTNKFGFLSSPTSGAFDSYYNYYKKIFHLIPSDFLELTTNYLNQDHSRCLNHGDVSPTHIFVDSENKYIALIDWDDVVSAPRKYDLSELLLNLKNDTELWNCFMEGYVKYFDYIDIGDKDLLIEEMLQIYTSYYWILSEKPNNLRSITKHKKQIKYIQERLQKYI